MQWIIKNGLYLLLLPLSVSAYEPKPYGVEPQLNNDVRIIMIQESNDKITECPCPYSPDKIGGQCGTQAKYYKPGAFKIWCYMKDIKSEDVYFYRIKYGTPYAIEHW